MNCLALEQGGEVLVVDCGVTFDDRGLGVDVVHPDFGALERLPGRGPLRHARPRGPHRRDPLSAPPVRRAGVRPALRARARARAGAEHEMLDHVDLREVTPRRARAGRLLRGRADPRHALDRRRHGARHPHRRRARSCTPATSSSTTRRPTARRSTSRASRSSRARACGCSSATRPTSTRAGRPAARRAWAARSTRSSPGAEQAVVVGDVRLERAPPAHARRHRAAARAQARAARAQRAHPLARRAGDGALDGRRRRAGRTSSGRADLVWPAERARELPRRAILGVATGSQGEEAAALARLARGEHPAFDLASRRRRRPVEPRHPGQRAGGRARDERPPAPGRGAPNVVVGPRAFT